MKIKISSNYFEKLRKLHRLLSKDYQVFIELESQTFFLTNVHFIRDTLFGIYSQLVSSISRAFSHTACISIIFIINYVFKNIKFEKHID